MFLLVFLLVFPVGVGILIVHLLKVEIFDDLLHLLDNVRFAYQILAIFLGGVTLICANLHHALRIIFI